MEKDHEQKHCCKVCNRIFPSGRSLGGHMRSHMPFNSSFDVDERAGYGLRKNPKKRWRLSDSDDDACLKGDKLCEVCGKRFPSQKSLLGHLKSHQVSIEEEEEEEGYEGLESQSDSEITAVMVSRKRRRRRLRRVAAISANSSSVSESEKEQEDGALSLMMLSRDFMSSDKNSLVSDNIGFETEKAKKGSESGVTRNGYQKNVSKKVESDVSDCGFVRDEDLDEFKKNNLNCGVPELGRRKRFNRFDPEVGRFDAYNGNSERKHITRFRYDHDKRSRYQCRTCNKIFHSYQALGGHRASHNRIEAYSSSMEMHSPVEPASIEETNNQNLGIKTIRGLPKRSKGHECLICHKVFPSGQALGGHKRSHSVSSSETNSVDLNILAPIDEESNDTNGNCKIEFNIGRSKATAKLNHLLI